MVAAPPPPAAEGAPVEGAEAAADAAGAAGGEAAGTPISQQGGGPTPVPANGGGVFMFINPQIGGSDARPRNYNRGRIAWGGMTQQGGGAVAGPAGELTAETQTAGAEITVMKEE